MLLFGTRQFMKNRPIHQMHFGLHVVYLASDALRQQVQIGLVLVLLRLAQRHLQHLVGSQQEPAAQGGRAQLLRLLMTPCKRRTSQDALR